jgi:hypothetical protein
VRITGRRLDSVRAVYVSGAMVYRFAERTAGSLVVKVPAHSAGRVTIAVSNAWGTARRTITYVGAPQISSLSPSSGPTAGGTTVTMHGDFLAGVRRVKIGGKSVGYRILGPHRLTFTTPAHPAGAVRVTASSPFGVSNPELYTFASSSPSPTPTSSNPTTSNSRRRAAPPPPPRTSPRARAVASRVYLDRVGDDWFLIGRLADQHVRPFVRHCTTRASTGLTVCLERSIGRWARRH